jgi:hypothetical protein
MQEFLDSWPLKMGLIGFPETSERNYHYSLRNSLEERSPPYFAVEAWETTGTLFNTRKALQLSD